VKPPQKLAAMVTPTLYPGDRLPLAEVNLAGLSTRVNLCQGLPELTVTVNVTWRFQLTSSPRLEAGGLPPS
jgi:hypothetical protein